MSLRLDILLDLSLFAVLLVPHSLYVALLVYDWLTSIDEEIALIWRHPRKRTVASLVYALTRYTNILQYVMEASAVVPVTSLVSIGHVSRCQHSRLTTSHDRSRT